MAKNRTEENTANQENTQAATNPAPAATQSDHIKMITLKDGTKIARKDYIRQRWAEKASRGQIAKELSELNKVENGGDGKKVPYQVVFAVIKKGTPGGPDPVATLDGEQASA